LHPVFKAHPHVVACASKDSHALSCATWRTIKCITRDLRRNGQWLSGVQSQRYFFWY